MSFCEICGDESCKDPMVHLSDDDIMSLIMELQMCHPYCYCPVCGHEHDVQEPDADSRPCESEDDCIGKVRHPQQVLEII